MLLVRTTISRKLCLGAAIFAVAGSALVLDPQLVALDRFQCPKLLALGIAAAVTAVGLCLCPVAERRRKTGVDIAFLTYLAVGALSAVVGGRVWSSGAGWLSQELAALLLFWGVSHALAEQNGWSSLVLEILCAAATVVAAVATLEGLGASLPLDGIRRPFSTLGSRNSVGPYVAATIPLAITSLVRARRFGLVLRAGQVTLLFVALILTRCRSAWIAMLAVSLGAAVRVALERFRSPVADTSRSFWRVCVYTTACLAAAIALVALVPMRGLRWTETSPYLSSLRRLTEYDAGTGRARIEEYSVGAKVIRAHPWLGVGPGQWQDAAAQYAADETSPTPTVPHSTLVRLVAETGLLGLAAFIVALAALLWETRTPRARTIGAALLVIAISGLFDPALHRPEILILLAVLAGTLRQGTAAADARIAPGAAGAALALAGAFCLVIPILRMGAAIAAAGHSPAALRLAQHWFPRPDVAAQIGLGLAHAGRCEDALPELKQAVEWLPHHSAPLLALTHCASQRGDVEQARQWARRAYFLHADRTR